MTPYPPVFFLSFLSYLLPVLPFFHLMSFLLRLLLYLRVSAHLYFVTSNHSRFIRPALTRLLFPFYYALATILPLFLAPLLP